MLLVIVCMGIGFLYGNIWSGQVVAEQLSLKVADQAEQHFHLDKDQVIEIHGELGLSRIEIKNHRVRFLSSPCQSQFCVRQGWVQHGGETLACLPNKIVLHLQGKENAFDSINF